MELLLDGLQTVIAKSQSGRSEAASLEMWIVMLASSTKTRSSVSAICTKVLMNCFGGLAEQLGSVIG